MNEGVWSPVHWFIGFNHYLYILAITIPFDIRDIHTDDSSQRTLPQVLGSRGARLLALLLLLIFAVCNWILLPSLRTNLLYQILVLYYFGLILATKATRPFWFFGGLLDGGIVLLGISYLIID